MKRGYAQVKRELWGVVKNRGRFYAAEEMICVCERERKREIRETRSVDIENTQVNVLTKEKESTTYKVGGGYFR